jgi:hypothetical protein
VLQARESCKSTTAKVLELQREQLSSLPWWSRVISFGKEADDGNGILDLVQQSIDGIGLQKG